MTGPKMPYDIRGNEVQGTTQAPSPPIPPLPAAPGAATGQAAGTATGAGTGVVTREQAQEQMRQAAENLRAAIQGEIGNPVAGTQGIVVQPPPIPRNPNEIPPEVIPLVGIVMSMVAVMVIGYPIARAMARMIDRRSDASRVKVGDVAPQLRSLQESVDAMAIEIERISEAQRFTAKLMAERAGQALPAGEQARG